MQLSHSSQVGRESRHRWPDIVGPALKQIGLSVKNLSVGVYKC